MSGNFPLLGPAHLAIAGLIPAIVAVLVRIARRSAAAARNIRLCLGLVLLGNETAWYGYEIAKGWMRFPDSLPLQFSQVTVWVTIAAALSLQPLLFDLAYFWALVGASMAVATPDLWAPWPSYPAVQFFIAHGGVVVTALFLTLAKVARPRPGSVWRAFGLLNAYALAIGIFNAGFGTNYMFLRERPASRSLLDVLGPWPVYVLAADALALGAFAALWAPFRKGARGPAKRS